MRALFIGGTGTISMAITRQLAANPDWELYLLNRGSRSNELPDNVIASLLTFPMKWTVRKN